MFFCSAFSFTGSFNSFVLIGVAIAPGAMELMVMPKGASSTARLRVIIFRPPLLMQ